MLSAYRGHPYRATPSTGQPPQLPGCKLRAERDTCPAMPNRARVVAPGPRARTVRTDEGSILSVPDSWSLLSPGDPALTGRVKKAGPHWTVTEKRGRKTFSHGVWAPAEVIEAIRSALLREREDPAYAKKLESGRRRRAAEQDQYAEDFTSAVEQFLDFASSHAELAAQLAK